MKIQLDPDELGAIITNWAKQKYKTHNISVMLENNAAIVEITMTKEQLTEDNSEVTDLAISRARQRILSSVGGFRPTEVDEQPDFSSAYDAMVPPLA